MFEYTNEEINKLYDTNPNELVKVFENVGLKSDQIELLFNGSTKEQVVTMAKDIIRNEKIASFKPTEFYEIPKKYKKENRKYKAFKKEINEVYDKINGTINKKTGEILEQIYNYDSDNYIIGIHRTGLNNFEDTIFKKGICYNSSNGYGGYNTLDIYDPYLYDHVQKFENFVTLLSEIKKCENYKGSKGCIITKIPKTGISECNNPTPIYYIAKDGNLYLKPEYICAYIPVRNKVIGECIFNKSQNNIYNNDTEFVYDNTCKKIDNNKRLGFSNIFLISIVLLAMIIIAFVIIK